ncbi:MULTISPECIES: CU044_2847 family protein [Aerosakkonema]|uniref:CU044_2847 family protein n=1 Tax=Aerosakkonema TaxID=1246629 RepID=UPI0035B97E5B
MSEVERLLVKEEDGTEYELFIEPSDNEYDVPDAEDDGPVTRAGIPTVNIKDVHKKIRGYTKFVLGAFKNFTDAEVEEVTIKFGIKLNGKTGIPFLTESSAEGNFEIEVKCKYPNSQKTQTNP